MQSMHHHKENITEFIGLEYQDQISTRAFFFKLAPPKAFNRYIESRNYRLTSHQI